MWAEFITPAAIVAIQHSFDISLWDVVRIQALLVALIILGLLLAVGFVGIVIAACTANLPALKSALAGIGLTVCAGIVAIIAMTAPHPFPAPMWWVICAGLVTAAVYNAGAIIHRIAQNTNPDD